MEAKGLLLAMVLSIACATTPAAGDDTKAAQRGLTPRVQQAIRSDQAERRELVYGIVRAWGPYVRGMHGEEIRAWADRLVPVFRQARMEALRDAAMADSYPAMLEALSGQQIGGTKRLPAAGEKALGDPGADLVFTPLPQCNLVDTRLAGGAFTALAVRGFEAIGTSFVGQGGSNTNCGIPVDASALFLGVTAVQPTGKGWFKIWPRAEAEPPAASISYGPTQNVRNDIVVRLAHGLDHDLSVMANTTGAHLLVSVLGYYAPPRGGAPLECQYTRHQAATSSAETVVRAGARFEPGESACPAGLTLMGVQCFGVESGALRAIGSSMATLEYPNDWWPYTSIGCTFINDSGAPQRAVYYRTCCRIPGR